MILYCLVEIRNSYVSTLHQAKKTIDKLQINTSGTEYKKNVRKNWVDAGDLTSHISNKANKA